MNAQAEVCVRDLGQVVLALRRDLVLTPRIEGEQPGYVIEDRVQSKFYRVGLPEYAFISLLDGRTTIRDALVIMARVEPEHAFDDGQAAAVVRWLLENELVLSSESAARPASRTASSGNAVEQRITRWNPICLRVPLLHPDRWLGRLLPWTDWLFTTPALAAAVCFGLISVYQICLQWDRFAGASRGILAEGKWVWMLTGWLVVKALHELAHGLVCKRYGGTVREAGVVLILAAPVAYVDVTSSWRFRTKWERIHTALAGIHIELLIAALSALLWSWLEPGVLSDLCYRLAVLCGVTTLLFNANPLMRFDGYYVLSDLVEIPNLASQGQQFLQHLLRRYLCGASSTLPAARWPRRLLIALYGLAALIWRGIVCCGLVLAAANLWQGAGLVLAVAAVVIWAARPAIAILKYFLGNNPSDPPQRVRCLVGFAALSTVVALAAVYLPWPLRGRAPAMVDYAPPVIVRSESPGFVRQVHVQPGQRVAAGQILLQLENEALQSEVEDLRLRVQESAARRRALNFQMDTPSSQAEREEQVSLEHRLQQREEELSALAVRTPVAGTVVARDLQVLLGTYVTQGAELLAIGSEDRKELRVSVAQNDMEFFRRRRGANVWVRVGGHRYWAPLTDICPRASQTPFHDALCAPLGGPLPVRELTPPDASRKQRATYELLAPRFEGRVALNAAQSLMLRAGQRAVVSLPTHGEGCSLAGRWHCSSGPSAWDVIVGQLIGK